MRHDGNVSRGFARGESSGENALRWEKVVARYPGFCAKHCCAWNAHRSMCYGVYLGRKYCLWSEQEIVRKIKTSAMLSTRKETTTRTRAREHA
jgi:hypothetical protein